MAEVFVRNVDGRSEVVGYENPMPVTNIDIVRPSFTLTVREMMERNMPWWDILTGEGRSFYGSESAQDTKLTGQTSFAATLATLVLDVPVGVVAVPTLQTLGQSGTVAGGDISIIIEVDNAKRLSSGTLKTISNVRATQGGPNPLCSLYSTVTTVAGNGARIYGTTVAADVAPAEGISNEQIWTPVGPDFLVGPASFIVYTYAAVTGPTWFWTTKWIEFPIARFGF
jgi:hypothetical protein